MTTKRFRQLVVSAMLVLTAGAPAFAKDLGDILLKKGLITEEELKQAREEEKQKSAAEESKRDAVAAKVPQWLDRITLFADLRTRYEGFEGNGLHGRNRFRLRARPGLTAKISDEVSGTVRLASGNSDDPISTNQSFERTFTRKPINLDQAYLTLRPGKTFGLEPGLIEINAGKFGINAYRASELIWDDDLSPEGASETFTLLNEREGFLRNVKLTGFQWVMDEITAGSDPGMYGGQVVANTAFTELVQWNLGFADYNYQHLNGVARKFLNAFNDPPTNSKANSSFNGQLANSNDVVKDANGKILGYTSGYNIVNGTTELLFTNPLGIGLPVGFFGDVAYNTQADGKNVGANVGVGIGKAGRDYYHNGLKNPGDWGASYTYGWVEKDAVLSLFSYSDVDYVQAKATQKGSTNLISHILRFDYQLLPNLQLTAKEHIINALDRKASNAKLTGNPSLFRTQIDAVLKF
ncbi:MAG: putative porin [Deltaproteobacteria bacterium]|nr:putative porin [Deltaproteobacteria bacterium]